MFYLKKKCLSEFVEKNSSGHVCAENILHLQSNKSKTLKKKVQPGVPLKKVFFSLEPSFLNFFRKFFFSAVPKHVALRHLVRKSAAYAVPERNHHARFLERSIGPADMCTGDPSVGAFLAAAPTRLQPPRRAAVLFCAVNRPDSAVLCQLMAGFQRSVVMGPRSTASPNQGRVFVFAPRGVGATTVLTWPVF